MEKCPMNRSGGRPMYGSRPRQSDVMNAPAMARPAASCPIKRDSMYEGVDRLPLAMAYVPFQTFSTTFDWCYALKVGTIFPDLCKPFCGKGGMCR